MMCQNCNSVLPYGTKYCNECGEAIPREIFEGEYKKTIWAKLDRFKDTYDEMLFKKITGSIVFKILLLLAIVFVGVYSTYTELNSISVEKSASYGVQYSKESDEYYIKSQKEEIPLNLGIPDSSDKAIIKSFLDGKENEKNILSPKEYEKSDIVVNKDDTDYLTVEIKKGKKTVDKIKLVIVKQEG